MSEQNRQPIDARSLERYLAKEVRLFHAPVKLRQFGFGQSNPTYELTDSTNAKYVLRKKPPGKLVSNSAHKVEREYRILNSLKNTDVPVPKVFCLCEDETVIGTPFYIMSFLDGRIFEDPSLPGVTSADRTEMWHDATRILAKLHRLDFTVLGLRCFGKAFNFYNRQIATLSAISEAQARVQDVDTKVPVGKIPNLAEIVEYFRQTQPADRASIVHGDFKIDNLVFHETEPRVIGILDWEMSTIGHPLSDLVNLTVPYLQEERSLGRGTGRGSNDFKPGVTLGLPTRDTIVRWYREAAGWDPSTDLPWGDAFGMLRATIIIQGIAGRYATRQASGIKAKEFASKLAPFAEYTWRLVSQLRERNLNSQARL